MNKTAMNILAQVFFLMYALISVECIPTSGIFGLWDRIMFNFKTPAVYQSGWNILYFYQQCMKLSSCFTFFSVFSMISLFHLNHSVGVSCVILQF